MESSRKIELHSGEETPCLPEQIIMEEILPRLPAKSLLKFRCVSKPWCSIIGSKRLIKAHLKYSIKTSKYAHLWIYFHVGKKQFKQCPLPSLFDNPFTVPIACNVDLGIDFERDDVSPVDCCNGLVCILINDKRFILWNPTTKKFKNLPDFNNEMSRGFISKYGFGFDELNDDYKVFGIETVFGVNGNVAIGKVYSLRSNSWKDIEENDHASKFNNEGMGMGRGRGIYVSGKLHWRGSKYDIVSFDLNRHVYGVVELPSYTNRAHHSVGAIGGCLSAHFVHPNGDLDVWLMKEYGVKESWDKVVTLPYYDDPDTCETHDPHTCETPIPVAVASNGEVLVVYDSTMVVYNPNSGLIRHPHVIGLDDSYAYIECMGICIESLASVESGVAEARGVW